MGAEHKNGIKGGSVMFGRYPIGSYRCPFALEWPKNHREKKMRFNRREREGRRSQPFPPSICSAFPIFSLSLPVSPTASLLSLSANQEHV